MRRFRDGDGNRKVQRVSPRTPSPKSLPGRGPLISHIPTGIWINLLRQDRSFSSPHPPGAFRIRLLQRFPSLPLLSGSSAASGQSGTGQAPRKPPRRKEKKPIPPSETSRILPRPKDKDIGHFRGSGEDLSLRTLREEPPFPGDDPFFKNPLKDSRESPMAASGQSVRIKGEEGIAFAGWKRPHRPGTGRPPARALSWARERDQTGSLSGKRF